MILAIKLKLWFSGFKLGKQFYKYLILLQLIIMFYTTKFRNLLILSI